MKPIAWFVVVELLWVLGCGDDVRTVRGSVQVAHIAPTGTNVSPVDLREDLVVVATLAEDGMYDEMVGQGSAAGTFEIPNVPRGTYYVLWQPSATPNAYLVQEFTQDDPTLTDYQGGRSDSTRPSQPTTTSLSIDALSPWVADDEVRLSVPNTDALDILSKTGSTYLTEIPMPRP